MTQAVQNKLNASSGSSGIENIFEALIEDIHIPIYKETNTIVGFDADVPDGLPAGFTGLQINAKAESLDGGHIVFVFEAAHANLAKRGRFHGYERELKAGTSAGTGLLKFVTKHSFQENIFNFDGMYYDPADSTMKTFANLPTETQIFTAANTPLMIGVNVEWRDSAWMGAANRDPIGPAAVGAAHLRPGDKIPLINHSSGITFVNNTVYGLSWEAGALNHYYKAGGNSTLNVLVRVETATGHTADMLITENLEKWRSKGVNVLTSNSRSESSCVGVRREFTFGGSGSGFIAICRGQVSSTNTEERICLGASRAGQDSCYSNNSMDRVRFIG